MASAVRVLYPALADNWQMSAAQIGFLYAAIPLGAAIGALTSGKLAHSVRPGLLMLLSTLGAFLAISLFGLMPMWILGVVCLALFGWLSAVSSLLQYTMLQTQTPEAMLGRINGLWTAQNVTGDAIGAALLGGLGAMMTPGCFRKRERFWFVDYRRVVAAGAGGVATFSPDAAAGDSVRQLMLKTAP